MIFTHSNEAFRKLPKHEQALLHHKLSDETFVHFIELQIAEIKNQIAEHDPGRSKTPEEFFQTAKDMRLILLFWNNFLDFASDWGIKQEASNNGEVT